MLRTQHADATIFYVRTHSPRGICESSADLFSVRWLCAARRKPIVLGPNSISVVVDGETHTLANVVRDNAWAQ